MRKSFVISFLFFIICFSIIGCSNNPDTNIPSNGTGISGTTVNTDNFPKLKIINKSQITILKVVLEGYDFSDLNLKQNQSIVLELKDGMPAGYKDVTISIRYRPYRVSNSPIPPILTKLDFADGATTSLEIKTISKDSSELVISFQTLSGLPGVNPSLSGKAFCKTTLFSQNPPSHTEYPLSEEPYRDRPASE